MSLSIPHLSPSRTSLLCACALAWASLSSAGCSLVVDFEQCAVDADCGRVDRCVDGICEGPEYVEVRDYIVDDTTWTADKIYVLKNVILVIQPATLTIEPGTLILGDRDSALVTQAGGRIVAEGTRDAPIVFSSSKPEGQRRAGDWGGLALIGKARINRDPMYLNIVTNQEDAEVGGDDDTWSCGTLKYVRTEFGGGLIDGQKALNGLTLAGCGSQTVVDYVQAHFGDDDGIEMFGGTVDVKHAVSSRPQGDGFDIDVGWRGRGQFWVVQMDTNGQEGIEIENRGEEPTATPQTDAQVYNYTIIGPEEKVAAQRGMIFKAGGLGKLSHGIVMGVGGEAVHAQGLETGKHGEEGEVLVENTLFYDIGDGKAALFSSDEDAGAGTFQMDSLFREEARHNVFDKDPGFSAPYDLGTLNLIPTPEHTTGRDIEPPPDGFDITAVYLGAFSPSSPAWTEGWTAFPKF